MVERVRSHSTVTRLVEYVEITVVDEICVIVCIGSENNLPVEIDRRNFEGKINLCSSLQYQASCRVASS